MIFVTDSQSVDIEEESICNPIQANCGSAAELRSCQRFCVRFCGRL